MALRHLLLFFVASVVVLGEHSAPFIPRWTIKKDAAETVLSRSPSRHLCAGKVDLWLFHKGRFDFVAGQSYHQRARQ